MPKANVRFVPYLPENITALEVFDGFRGPSGVSGTAFLGGFRIGVESVAVIEDEEYANAPLLEAYEHSVVPAEVILSLAALDSVPGKVLAYEFNACFLDSVPFPIRSR